MEKLDKEIADKKESEEQMQTTVVTQEETMNKLTEVISIFLV